VKRFQTRSKLMRKCHRYFHIWLSGWVLLSQFTASWFVCLADFQSIRFWPVFLASSHSNLEESINIRGFSTLSNSSLVSTKAQANLMVISFSKLYTNVPSQHHQTFLISTTSLWILTYFLMTINLLSLATNQWAPTI